MEVSGTLADFSKQESNLYCLPCERDDMLEQAYGYCQDCEEHLCESCYKHHRKPRPTRNHILLDKDAMPKLPKTENTKPDKITDICTKHSDKLLEFFCDNHCSTACYVCVTLEHKQCKVDYIPDVSQDLSNELNGLIGKLENLLKRCKSNIEMAEIATINVEKTYRIVIEDISLYRKEINKCLDQMEAEISNEAKDRMRIAKSKQEYVKTENQQIAEELSCSLSSLNSLNDEKKQNKLFVEMKNVGPRVARLSDKERETIQDNITDDDIKFLRNEKIFDKLKSEKNLGTISTYRKPSADSAICFTFEETIQVAASSDKGRCNITAIEQVSSTRMVVADYNNNKIKMISLDDFTLVSELLVSSRPFHVSKLPNNELAVTLPDEKRIQVMSFTETSLSLDRRIAVRETCYSVAYCQDKLVVGCNENPGKLLVLNLAGNEQIFDSPVLHGCPVKIVVSSDEKFLYVSDYNNSSGLGKFIKVDWQGSIVQKFEERGYKYPTGIQELKDGSLLVCFFHSHNIVRLSSSLKKCEIVGVEKLNLQYPTALLYNDKDHILYVSCSSDTNYQCDLMKVIILQWM